MIEKWIALLGQAIVTAFLKWANVEDVDALIGEIATAVKAELSEELGKLDDIPRQVIDEVSQQVNGVVQQVGNIPGQVIGQLPNFAAIIQQAIGQFNPFK